MNSKKILSSSLLDMKGTISRHGVGILLAVPLFGMAFPYGFPLFPFAVIIVLYSIIYSSYEKKLKLNVKPYSYMLFCLSLILYYLVYFYDTGNYLARRDILSTIVIFVTAICFMLTQTNRSIALNTLKFFNEYYVSVMFIVCLLSIIKAILMIADIYVIDQTILGTSLNSEYNMYSLAILVAALICIFEESIKLKKCIYIMVFSICIILSTSRRGAIILCFLLFAMTLYMLYCFFRYVNYRFVKNIYITAMLAAITIITPTYYIFDSFASYQLSESLTNQEIDTLNNESAPDFSLEVLKNNALLEVLKKNLSVQKEKIFNRIKTIRSTGNTGVVYQRFIRVEQSKDLFNELSLKEKLFGSGYSYHFYFKGKNNLAVLDYPHNILLSTLFSQGFLGVCLLLLILSLTTKNTFYLFKQKGSQWLMFANMLFIFYMLTGGDTLASNKYYIVFSLFTTYLFTAHHYEKSTSNTNTV